MDIVVWHTMDVVEWQRRVLWQSNTLILKELPRFIDQFDTADPPLAVPDEPVSTDEETFNNDDLNCKGLTFIHLNVRSLRPKLTELAEVTLLTQKTIFAVSETWFCPSMSNIELYQATNYSGKTAQQLVEVYVYAFGQTSPTTQDPTLEKTT